jgi:hypothetical protein
MVKNFFFVRVPTIPSWQDSFNPATSDMTISNGDSAFTWIEPIIIPFAGTASSVRAHVSVDPFNSSLRIGLYDPLGNFLTSASLGASAVGWNTLAIANTVVIPGTYSLVLKALANADLEWTGLSTNSVGLNFGDMSYFAPFPAVIPATNFPYPGGIAAGIFVSPTGIPP